MLQGLILTLLVAAPSLAQPQLPQYDYDYLYEDLLASLDLGQPGQAQASTARPENVTHIAVLKDARYTDPATGAFIYDYMGADGSGKYEVRFLNGTVVGNYTYLNEAGERETRWYSAGTRGTEIAGDGVVSPAPPTLVDETTGANYVDLSNYELYRHLEVPYVHIAGPSDPDERGQLSNPDRRPARPSPVALDHGDITSFSTNLQAAQRQQQQSVFRQHQQQQQPRQQQQQQPRQQQPRQQPRQRQSQPARVSRVRTPQPQQPQQQQVRPASNFNPGAVGGNSPNQVLDSLINQFQ